MISSSNFLLWAANSTAISPCLSGIYARVSREADSEEFYLDHTFGRAGREYTHYATFFVFLQNEPDQVTAVLLPCCVVQGNAPDAIEMPQTVLAFVSL